jgi:hypothetical protein
MFFVLLPKAKGFVSAMLVDRLVSPVRSLISLFFGPTLTRCALFDFAFWLPCAAS